MPCLLNFALGDHSITYRLVVIRYFIFKEEFAFGAKHLIVFAPRLKSDLVLTGPPKKARPYAKTRTLSFELLVNSIKIRTSQK